MSVESREISGLGGWLILPMLGLIITPFTIGFNFVHNFLPIFTEGTWEIITTPGTEAYHPLWKPLICFEIGCNSILLLFDLALLVLFFTKAQMFPLLMSIFLISNLVFTAGDVVFTQQIPFIAEQLDMNSYKPLVRSFSSTLIWVPYFMMSERVKNTFI